MFLRVYLLWAMSIQPVIEGQTCYPNTESFIKMVLSNITAANNYVKPINNSKLYQITDQSHTYDYGVFDFIIVGAGSAGTLLANRLTEVKHWRILLLEAGGQENDFSDIPGMAAALDFTDMNWGYKSVPQKYFGFGMVNNSILAPRGKVLGGSSVINAKMYVRGNKADFDYWEQMGNAGWSYENVLPYFIKTENSGIPDGDPGYHSKGGLLNVNYTEPTFYAATYLEAIQQFGLNTVDYNGRNQIGGSRVAFTIKGNKIASGGRAFIDPIVNKRSNLNVTLNAFVTKLLIDELSKTIYGVAFIKNGNKYIARASKEVILSAGTFNSPQILMLSGIGPTEVLKKIKKSSIIDLPVGRYMQDHPAFFGLRFRTNTSLFNQSIETSLIGYLNGHRPFTAANNIECVSFINTNDKNGTVPNIQQILIVPLGVGKNVAKYLNLDNKAAISFKNFNQFTDFLIWIVLLHPKSRGTLTLKSKSPVDFPDVDYNFFSDPDGEDIETIYNGILETLKLTKTEPFKSINATYQPLLIGCDKYAEFSKEYWYCAIRHLTQTLYHPVGTTRMGISKTNSVVSSDLKVHGIRKLRIVDAGVMPEITSGNTNAPTYMIAERISDVIKREYKVLK